MTVQTQRHWTSQATDTGGATIKDEHGGYIAHVQWRENGPLVAAAPELLAALEEAQKSIDWFFLLMEESVIDRDAIADFDRTALAEVEEQAEKALAAIKRARGED